MRAVAVDDVSCSSSGSGNEANQRMNECE